jgi:hypothetical protein
MFRKPDSPAEIVSARRFAFFSAVTSAVGSNEDIEELIEAALNRCRKLL